MISPQKSREKYGKKLTATINHSPIQVIIECENGEEFSIQKAYFVGGRAAAVKILIEGDGKTNALQDKIDELKEENEKFEKENKELEKTLHKWETAFGSDPDSFVTLWDEVEAAIQNFAKVANFRLGSNDGTNIDILCGKYEDLQTDLNSADETIGELKLENISLTREIQNLKNQLAILEKEAKVQP